MKNLLLCGFSHRFSSAQTLLHQKPMILQVPQALWMNNNSKCLNCVSGPLVRHCTWPSLAQYSTSPMRWQPSFHGPHVSPTSLTTALDRAEQFLKIISVLIMYMCLGEGKGSEHVHCWYPMGQKRRSVALEMELWVFVGCSVWVLAPELCPLQESNALTEPSLQPWSYFSH